MALVKEIVHLGKDDTILDLACGTGLYTRYLVEKSRERKAIGIDISWPMLKYAVKKANDEKIENAVILHGDSHYLPLRMPPSMRPYVAVLYTFFLIQNRR